MICVTNTYYDIIVNGKRFLMVNDKEQAENIAKHYNGTVKEFTKVDMFVERRKRK